VENIKIAGILSGEYFKVLMMTRSATIDERRE